MKLKILAAAVCAAALPVLAQSTSAPVEPRQAQLEVSQPGGASTTAPKKASKSTKAHKSTKTAKKSKKKSQKAQSAS